MRSRFSVPTSTFEPVFRWLSEHPDYQVEVWALADDRRVALIASGNGTELLFDWSPWVKTTLSQPIRLVKSFKDLEIEIERRAGMKLWAAFPWTLTTLGGDDPPPMR